MSNEIELQQELDLLKKELVYMIRVIKDMTDDAVSGESGEAELSRAKDYFGDIVHQGNTVLEEFNESNVTKLLSEDQRKMLIRNEIINENS